MKVVCNGVGKVGLNSWVENFKDELGSKEYEPMSAADEMALCIAYKNGDQKAKDSLIKSNLRYVVKMAEKYKHCTSDYADIIANGNLGLCEAVERYDYKKGVRLLTYASPYVFKYIMESLEKSFNYEDNFSSFDVYSRCDEDDNGCYILNTIPCDVAVEEDREAEELCKVLNLAIVNLLDEREAFIVKAQYGIGCEKMAVKDIALKLNITEERVRQIKQGAFKRMRENRSLVELRTAC